MRKRHPRSFRTIAIAAVFAAGFGAGIWAAGQTQQAPSLPAERVTGIGGVFFKARDPRTLRTWYQEKLGIALQDGANFGLFPGASVRIRAAKAQRSGVCFRRRRSTSPQALRHS
jgi:hypothetical protein